MIKVITSISYDASLLPHFVDYYLSIGVDAFIISIDEKVKGIRDEVNNIIKNLAANIELVSASERQRTTGVELNNKEETRQRFVKDDDWIIPADLDEFIQYPEPLSVLIKEMAATGATFIMGDFRDRIARHGVLLPTRDDISIWKQYPDECNISKKLVRCWCHKVILCRGDCELTSGHHNVITPAKPLLDLRGIVHHFKWREGLVHALERRLETYKIAGYGAQAESQRIIDYLTLHGRIIPQEFNSTEGWQPGLRHKSIKNVIYTAITNDYDILKGHQQQIDGNVCFIAFTDAVQNSLDWQRRSIRKKFIDPCRNAKIYKILPHIYFPEAEYSLWIDGSIQIKPDFIFDEMVDLFLKDHDIAVFRHRKRKCIYAEAERCIKLSKDDTNTIKKQVDCYRYECFPSNLGLAECSIILRRHSEKINRFNELWWDEISKYSRRDQLSFNYVAWKLRLKYKSFPGYIAKNQYFKRLPHNKKSVSI